MNDVLSSARDIANKIFIEEVPSAREFLSPIIEALRNNQTIKFTYHPYTRSMATPDVIVEPYFLKRFKQRWYITGRHVQEDKVKTYALDRMSNLNLQTDKFVPDPTFDAEAYFKDSFGIVFTHNEVKQITLKVDSHQAKYFRALPLHSSQREMVHDAYSIFKYNLRITPDFVEELLSHGPRVVVVSPPELRAMVMNELEASIRNYKEQEQ
jgi:predicted DNA-binding transcriptional regulator YafY